MFPVGRNKKPIAGGDWNRYATTDPETIATWWSLDYPDAMIAVHCQLSNLVVLDLDRHTEDADGFLSLELGWLGIVPSFEYNTATNEGRHVWYRAPRGVDLPSAPRYRGMNGCDRKSGAAYVVFWGTVVPDAIQLADAPEWLLDHKDRREAGDSFEGGLDEYLATLAEGEPTDKVLSAIERIPSDFDHNEMIARQTELVRLGAEGRMGVKVALDLLREAWTRPPYDDEVHRYEYDVALDGAIRKFGAQSARIAALPLYKNCMDKLGAAGVDMLVGAKKGKGHYFAAIKFLARQGNLNQHEIASLIWNAPATMAIARDWDIDYLYGQIHAALAALENSGTPGNPALSLDGDENKSWDFTLLTDEERAANDLTATFVDRYCDWTSTKVNVLNEPYHRANALTILSVCFGARVFAPLKSRPLGVNLFQLTLGESSTGKSESIALQNQILRVVFQEDAAYDVGSNASPEALQEALLQRNHQPSLFNTDEAAAPLTEFLLKTYQSGTVERLTSYYEGYVPPMLRRGKTSSSTNVSAVTSFNIAMYGTPERVIGLLSRDMFASGFLARFLWTFSDDIEPDDSQYEESEATERIVEKSDPAVEAFALTLGLREDGPVNPVPMLCDPAVLERLTVNRKAMDRALAGHQHWDILQPSIRRLGDNVRKIATLLAAGDGLKRVHIRQALSAIGFAEEFLATVEQVASRVSASQFERMCDEVEAYIVAQGGDCPETRVFNEFRRWELKEAISAVEALKAQGRVIRHEETHGRGARLEINTNPEVD